MKKSFLFSSLLVVLLTSSCSNVTPDAASNQVLPVKENAKEDKDAPPPLNEAEKGVLQKLGGELLPDQNIKIGDITILRREKEISFPGTVNMTSGDLEVLISMPHGRVHESLLGSKVDPMKLQIALLLLGAENGTRTGGEKIKQGTVFNIDVKPEGGKRIPVENWLSNKQTSKPMDRLGWVFVGSSFSHDMLCLAKEEGNIVNIWSFGNTILDNPASTGENDDFIVVNPNTVGKYQSPVTIYFSFRDKGK
ncbi:MAG TPA: hypothetical protein DCZ94_16970 [Lentisphaeria bacterium]|nr:MAG: hypothetical protein A2X48_08610 [Lentisphaerae bacterium GWF2_49_21]HBC88642.1 hypothetical protein [Lentisphaeria bacterium]